MKSARGRAATIVVGLLAACAVGAGAAAKDPPANDVDLSKDSTHRYGESQIAVNPKNPNNIIYASLTTGYTYACEKTKDPNCELVKATLMPGAPGFDTPKGFFTAHDFNSVTVFVSNDRGNTWTRATVPMPPKSHPKLTGWGDPSVTATPDGTFYLSFDVLDWNTPEKPLPAAGVGVSKSTDGGKTWSNPHLTGTPSDGPKITADPITGTVYIASSTTLGPHASGDPTSPPSNVSDRWIASTTDGVHWTTPQASGGGSMHSAAFGTLAVAIKTQPKANLFGAANDELCGDAPKSCTIFETTTDSGATWSRHVMAVPTSAPSMSPMDQPLVAADPSKKGHFAVGLLSNNTFNVYQTADGGNTWTGPVAVTEDATKQHYHAWLAYSPTGALGIAWRTRQPAAQQAAAPPASFGGLPIPPSTPYNVWAAVSTDGGATFSAPLEAGSADSPAPEPGLFGNNADDYSNIALDREYAYVSWADWRSADRSAYFRAIKLDAFKPKQ